MRPVSRLASLLLSLLPSVASAQQSDVVAPQRVPTHDPTGGAYTPASPLFTPAAALPTWNVRARAGVELQPASGGFALARPLLDLEVGLPAGFTLAAGSAWVGGTPSRAEVDGVQGLSAYGQVRWQFLGRGRETGLLGGVAVALKANGYRGGEPEVETSVSLHYRAQRFELGLQGTFGQGFEAGERDLEGRLFAAYRVIPSFALGVSGQVRAEVGDEAEEASRAARCASTPGTSGCNADADLITGVTAHYTMDRWQLGVLVGASSVGLARIDQFRLGFYSQVGGTVRF